MGAQLSCSIPVEKIAQFTSSVNYGSIMTLNRALAKRMGALQLETKTSVINESEINNMIDLNPLLMKWTIEIDHRNETIGQENLGDKSFPNLRDLDFKSDHGEWDGTGVELQWLAHKMTNRAVDNLNIVSVSRPHGRVVYAFMKELHTITTLKIRWDQLEWLLLQNEEDADFMKLLDTISVLWITMCAEEPVTSRMFHWLYRWAKSTTEERSLFLNIEIYNMAIHNAIMNALHTPHHVETGHGLVLLQLKINHVDPTLFQPSLFMNADIALTSGTIWAHFCKSDTKVNILIDTPIGNPPLTMMWLTVIMLDLKIMRVRLDVQLVIHFSEHWEDEFSMMSTPFEKLLDTATTSIILQVDYWNQFDDMDRDLMDTSIRDFMKHLDFNDNLNVSFVCPTHSQIPNIQNTILAAANATPKSFMRKYLILGGHIVINQTEAKRRRWNA